MAAHQDSPSKRVQQAVAQLVHHGDAAPLLELTEELEISPPPNTSSSTLETWQTLQILACIHSNDLINAKFIVERIEPKALEKNKPLATADNAARLLWSSSHAEALQTLSSFGWTGALQPVVDATIQAVRQRELSLMASTYTHVSISQVSQRLGLSEDETLQLCQQHGWRADARSGMLRAPERDTAESAQDFVQPAALEAASAALQGLVDTAVTLEGSSGKGAAK